MKSESTWNGTMNLDVFYNPEPRKIQKKLADPNFSVSMTDDNGMTALLHAASAKPSKDKTDSLRLIIQAHKTANVSLEQTDCHDQTAFMFAASLGDFDVVNLLIDHVDPNAVDDKGFSANDHARIRNHSSMAEFLVGSKTAKEEELSISNAASPTNSKERRQSSI